MNQLYMVRLMLDMPHLTVFAKRRGIPLNAEDNGYAVHCALVETFGKEYAPKPFSLGKSAGRYLEILGYTIADKSQLENVAKSFAKPEIYELHDWQRFAVKPMPTKWQEGNSYVFAVTVCPVVRKSSENTFHKKGAEVDAFLAAVEKKKVEEPAPTRENVYREWLTRQMEREAAIKIVRADLKGYNRSRLIRRDKERNAQKCEKPEAIFEGELIIQDSAAFTDMLARGIGRHRAFGYGMILLKPVRG